jgi:eukaryotic-like serine/threonine-protein kinase
MPAPGDILGHYRIEEPLGKGAFGAVFRGEDVRLGRKVAIKVPHVKGEEDAAAWGQLLQEARAASALNHPNICATYDIGEEAGVNYIALEYVEGQTLSDLIRSGPVSTILALSYASQIAQGLEHAHARGIIHRDLKASNVMITSDGHAKLLDFGLARHIDPGTMESVMQSRQSLAEIHSIAGTLSYMAPEVLRGKPPRPASDLWSLGALLYETLSGRLPFKGETAFELTMAIMVETPEPLSSSVPESVRSLVEKCLRKEPDDRFANAREVLDSLEAARASIVGRANQARSWKAPLGIALASLVAIFAMGLVWRSRQTRSHAPQVAVIQKESPKDQQANPAPSAPAPATPSEVPKRSSTSSPSRQFPGNPNVEVWVNLKTRIYHCPGTRWYKKTADGTLLKQRQAQLQGYKPASHDVCE